MSTNGQSLDPETGSAKAVQNAATALELNRGRLAELLHDAETGKRSSSPLPASGLRLVFRGLAGAKDLNDSLQELAEQHPYRLLAAGAAVGGLAYFALPRLAAGLVVPILWSEGRQLVHEAVHGWLSAGRRAGKRA